MRTISKMFSGVLPVLFAVGCGGGPSLGNPEAPTSSQMSANMQLGSSTTDLVAIKAGGDMGQSKVVGLQALMAGVGTQGTKTRISTGLPFPLGPKPLAPTFMPSNCVTTNGASWSYNMCKSDDGQTTFNGSVNITGDRIVIDLTISSTSQGSIELKLKGDVTVTATSIDGFLSYDIGASVGVVNTSITTRVEYRKVTFASGCVTGGSIYISYKGSAIDQAAEFVYTGCNMLQVKNAT